MSKNQPGGLATLAAVIGILGYLVADIFGQAMMENLLTEPQSFEEGLGQIIVTLITFAVGITFNVGGSLFVLLGQIWKQSSIVVIISLIAFGLFLIPMGYLTLLIIPTIASLEGWITLLLLWAYFIGMLVAHIKGLTQ